MKPLMASLSVAALLSAAPALADPTLMLGGSFTFGAQGSEFGISARVLHNDRVDQGAVGAGVTYYPGSGEVGFDVFAGYVFDGGVLGVGYDFGRQQPLVGLGFANTDDGPAAVVVNGGGGGPGEEGGEGGNELVNGGDFIDTPGINEP